MLSTPDNHGEYAVEAPIARRISGETPGGETPGGTTPGGATTIVNRAAFLLFIRKIIHQGTESMQRHGKIFRSIPLAAILTLGAAAAGCGPEQAGKGETTVSVKVLTLGERDVALAESARLEAGVPISGTLEPSETADVKAELPGTITGLRADAGSPVSRGQVLGVITAEGIRSQAASAQAGIQAAEANLALARQRMESMKSLFETGAVAKLEYDNARTAVEAAQAQVAAARAQATGAREQVGRATVNSPLGGTVSQRVVNNGEAVNPGQKLFTIVNASTLELAGQIPASERGNIRVGQPVALTLSADPARPVRGTIARIEPVADLQTRQVGVYVRVDNPNGAIVAGQFVNGTILTEGVKVATVVPKGGIRRKGDTVYALVVANDVIAQRPLTIGTTDEVKGVVEVISGIRPGEHVIISPTVTVEPGTKVRLAGAAGTPAAGTPAAGTTPNNAAPNNGAQDSARRSN